MTTTEEALKLKNEEVERVIKDFMEHLEASEIIFADAYEKTPISDGFVLDNYMVTFDYKEEKMRNYSFVIAVLIFFAVLLTAIFMLHKEANAEINWNTQESNISDGQPYVWRVYNNPRRCIRGNIYDSC